MSGEMLTFCEAVSKLQEAEEDMVEFHRRIYESQTAWSHTDKILLTMTNQVEYDQEGIDKILPYIPALLTKMFLYSVYSTVG